MQDLFGDVPDTLPPGFSYEPNLVAHEEGERLTTLISHLSFEEFDFHGFKGKRRVVSFGWKYDFAAQRLVRIEPIPAFLLPLRRAAADFAGLDPQAIEHALVTEYSAGAAIGWHRDKAVFDEVVGVSFGAQCLLRFRKRLEKAW